MLYTKFFALQPIGSEEKKDFFYRFLWFNLRTPEAGPFRIIRPSSEQNSVKNHEAMLHTKFQASEPRGFEEDFSIFFYVFLWFKPRTSCG